MTVERWSIRYRHCTVGGWHVVWEVVRDGCEVVDTFQDRAMAQALADYRNTHDQTDRES